MVQYILLEHTLQVYIKNTDLISQNVFQVYFFCRNNIDFKYNSSSAVQQVEVYLKYTSSIFQVTSSILEV